MNPETIDSLLQVTPEQKAAIEASRVKGDSIFKDLRKNKHEAEKALGEALEGNDKNAIDAAKAKVLEADKALLEHRINGVQALAGILSKEQFDKFNQFHKEQMKKFREFKKGPKGPREGHHEGPHHGNPPPMPPQE
jgi:Spy/CpxP family protein refolding chaperone